MAGDKTKSLFQYYKKRATLDAAKEGMPAGAIAFLEGEGNGVLYFKASGTEFKIPGLVNNLTGTSTTNALTAAQGKALNDAISGLRSTVDELKNSTGTDAAAKIAKLEKSVSSIIAIQQTLVLTAADGTPLTVTPGTLSTAEDGSVTAASNATISLNVKEGGALKIDSSKNLYVDNAAIRIAQSQVNDLPNKITEIEGNIGKADSSISDIYKKLDTKLNKTDTSIFTQVEKNKLESISAGAQVNVIESITASDTNGGGKLTASITSKVADITSLIDARVKGEQAVKGVKSGDKILSLGADGMLSAAVSLVYEDKNIILKDKDGVAISTVSAAPFVKDGMLESVTYDASTKKIKFTWNTASEIAPVEISLKEFIDTYVADETTITLDKTGTNPTFKVKDGVFVKKTDYDTKVADIDSSISNVKASASSNSAKISDLETTVGGHTTKITTLLDGSTNTDSVKGQIEAAKKALTGDSTKSTDASIDLYGVRKYADKVAGAAAVGVNVTAEGDDLIDASASGKNVTVKATESLKTAVTHANAAVRGVTTGTGANGTISVNTGGTAATVSVKGLDAAGIMAFEKAADYAKTSALATTNSNVSAVTGRVSTIETALAWYVEE